MGIDVGQVRFNNPAQDRWAQKLKQALLKLDAQTSEAKKAAAYAATVGGTTTVVTTPGTGGDDDTIEAPTAPENFEAIGGFSSIFLQWDMPTYNGHNFTRIYRSDTNAFGDSQWIADVFGKLHSDTDLGFDVGYYYWARHVNKNGVQSALHDVTGAYAKTARSYDSVIGEAREDVLDALAVWQNGVGDALSILDNETLNLVLNTEGAIETLTSRVNVVESNAQALYDDTVTAAANELGSAVTKVEQLAATLYSTDGDGNIQYDADGNPILTGAFINRVDAVLATKNGELMAAVGETLNLVDNDGNSYSLSEVMELAIDTAGNFQGQWGVKTAINELLYGVGLAYFTDDEGEQRVGFHVAAHTFAVYNPANGEEVFPLIVNDAGEVLINTAIIDTATITTLIAETIITEDLFATKTINGPIINAGEFFGGSININDVATIDEQGKLTALNAYIKGKIEASEGYLDNVTIRDTCTVQGTVYANKIEGDVLDRFVVVVTGEYTVGASSNYTLVQGNILPGLVGPDYNRVLTISGLAFDHQGGGGSTSNFDVALYVDGTEVQRFNSRNVNEEGSVSVSLGAIIPQGTDPVHFRASLETDVNDNILVQQSAIVIDVTKSGETLSNISSLYNGSTDPNADTGDTGSGTGGGTGGGYDDDWTPKDGQEIP
jgi:predicted phage tail protein